MRQKLCDLPIATIYMECIINNITPNYSQRCIFKPVKPVTDEQVFYDKFSYDKFYLLV
jgi:hypothetical protein